MGQNLTALWIILWCNTVLHLHHISCLVSWNFEGHFIRHPNLQAPNAESEFHITNYRTIVSHRFTGARNRSILFLLASVRGRSQTTLTRFWLFLTTYPPPLTFSMVWTLTWSGHFWTTYLPRLVNVVCERPLISHA